MISKLIGQSPEYYMLYEILRKLEMVTRMAPNIGWNTGGTVITTTTAAPITTTTTTTAFAFDSNYQATLDQATALGYTKPNSAQQTLHNNLIISIKTGLGANWSKVRRFYLPANNGSTEFGKLNWVAPTTKEAIFTVAPTWVSNRGWISNGSTSYVRIPFLSAEYAGIQGNLSVMVYSSRVNDTDLNLNLFGFQTDASRTFRLRTKVTTDIISMLFYASAATTVAAGGTRGGLYHARALTGDFAVFRNATKNVQTPTVLAPTAGGGDMGLLTYNSTANAGTFTASTFVTGEYASWLVIGDAFTDAEHTVIYNAFETYRAAISLT